MTHTFELASASVIQLCPEHHIEVLSCRHEVLWPDGTRVDMHPVRQSNAPSLLLRAVHRAATGQWVLFDLAQLIPHDVVDIKQAHTRDQVGLVMYALRRRYHNAGAFNARVDRHTLATWPGEGRPGAARPKLVKPVPNRATGQFDRAEI
ncbi:MAG: hypothetical protein SHS37scaffold296_29 [Burkholderiales phage 68_11]|jgi:hypothetical protein|nr:MAG: hypothetical protein SHS37scaffold296_29 [Burkholderiales phage 68_11]